jgi:hypothetical protein
MYLSSSGTQPSLPSPRFSKQTPRPKRPTRCSAPKLRGYRGIEALDRCILDFRGIVSTAGEWLGTCRAYIIQQIDLFQSASRSAASGQQMRGICTAPRPVLHPAGQSALLPRRYMPLQRPLKRAGNGLHASVFVSLPLR